MEGLIDRPGRGRKSSLSKDQMGELSELLLKKSPTSYQYNTENWTGPLLIDWIKNNFGLTFKKAQIYNIIRQMGFTYQKAKGFYPESDPVAQEEFKESLKKTSG